MYLFHLTSQMQQYGICLEINSKQLLFNGTQEHFFHSRGYDEHIYTIANSIHDVVDTKRNVTFDARHSEKKDS